MLYTQQIVTRPPSSEFISHGVERVDERKDKCCKTQRTYWQVKARLVDQAIIWGQTLFKKSIFILYILTKFFSDKYLKFAESNINLT